MEKRAYQLIREIEAIRKTRAFEWLEKQRDMTLKKNPSGEWLLKMKSDYFHGESLLDAIENAIKILSDAERDQNVSNGQ